MPIGISDFREVIERTQKNPSYVYVDKSLFIIEQTDSGCVVELAIPNHEVRILYQLVIEHWLSQNKLHSTYQPMMQAVLTGEKLDTLQQYLTVLLHQMSSVHDMAHHPEGFYHGLLLGLLGTYAQTYEINSNQESGLGRYDIAVAKKTKPILQRSLN